MAELPEMSIEELRKSEGHPPDRQYYCEYCGEEELKVFVVDSMGTVFCDPACWEKLNEQVREHWNFELVLLVRTKAKPGEPRCGDCKSLKSGVCEMAMPDDAVCALFNDE